MFEAGTRGMPNPRGEEKEEEEDEREQEQAKIDLHDLQVEHS